MRLRNPDIDPESTKPGYTFKSGKDVLTGLDARISNPKNRLKSQSWSKGDPVLDKEGNPVIGKDGQPKRRKSDRDVIPLTNVRAKLDEYASKGLDITGMEPPVVEYDDPNLVDEKTRQPLKKRGPNPDLMVQPVSHKGKDAWHMGFNPKTEREQVVVDEADFEQEVADQRAANESADRAAAAAATAEANTPKGPRPKRGDLVQRGAAVAGTRRRKDEDGEFVDTGEDTDASDDPKASAAKKIKSMK